jgi:hypothetical protein
VPPSLRELRYLIPSSAAPLAGLVMRRNSVTTCVLAHIRCVRARPARSAARCHWRVGVRSGALCADYMAGCRIFLRRGLGLATTAPSPRVDVLGPRASPPQHHSEQFRTLLSTYRVSSIIVAILRNAVQNGRRHVDVNLLGMWWSAAVVVLCLRGMRR